MYCTVADVRAALTPGSGSNDRATASGMDDAQIEDSIQEASDVVAQHMRGYPVPVEAPRPIRFWTRNIAAYLATLVYSKGKDVGENDPVRLRYEMTMALLARISSGEVDLPFPIEDPNAAALGDLNVFNQYTGTLFGPSDFSLGYPGSHATHSHSHWPGY